MNKLLSGLSKIKSKISALAVAAVAVLLGAAEMARADVDDLFAAVDVTGVSSSLETLMITFIGLAVLFLGFRFVKRLLSRA